MAAESTSTTKDWILFLISTVVFVYMILFVPQWFWLALPFVCTYLVKAMRVM